MRDLACGDRPGETGCGTDRLRGVRKVLIARHECTADRVWNETDYDARVRTLSVRLIADCISRKGLNETARLAEDKAVGIVTCGDNNGWKTSVPCIGALRHERFSFAAI